MALEARRLLCAVLNQKGGEVVITAGTLAQTTYAMGFEVVPNPKEENELIVRVITEGQ